METRGKPEPELPKLRPWQEEAIRSVLEAPGRVVVIYTPNIGKAVTFAQLIGRQLRRTLKP